ncbi:MAG: MotA/TolQ/ExbB proton channel family protein [Proteobacteria bacterium]|nr:MotA/TolQ/ExbB proton channel family protein [Pseudomonadota bacterium]
MDLVQLLLKTMIVTGASWVLWALVALSVLSLGIILERTFVFHRLGGDAAELGERLVTYLEVGDLEKARRMLGSLPSVAARVAYEGLLAFEKGPESAAEAMAAAKAMQRTRMEERLAILGTLGNNAPFIGLLGTVIGIIKAFHDLSVDNAGAAKAVMGGISEALVATAMGLFVAIPAVMAFNYFQRRIRAQITASDGLVHLLLAELRRRPEAGLRAPQGSAQGPQGSA